MFESIILSPEFVEARALKRFFEFLALGVE
jgi:hypothetical protein